LGFGMGSPFMVDEAISFDRQLSVILKIAER
jgi:hypothetical protein